MQNQIPTKLLKDIPNILETYSHVYTGLSLRWGTVEFTAYCEGLLTDTREHVRKGFPLEVVSEIMHLQLIHKAEFPTLDPINTDPWSLRYQG